MAEPMTAPEDTAALVEMRCRKPGCGALKRVGNPCTDWDCPQRILTANEHRDVLAALSRELVERLRHGSLYDNTALADIGAAADALAALSRELEAVKAERERLREALNRLRQHSYLTMRQRAQLIDAALGSADQAPAPQAATDADSTP